MEEFDKKYQNSLLKMMITNYTFMMRCRKGISPEYFDRSRSSIADLILKYYDRYNTVPTERALTDQLEEILETTKLNKFEKIIRKVYDELWEMEYPRDGDYIEEKLVDFAKTQSYVSLAEDIPQLVATGDYSEIDRRNFAISQIGIDHGVRLDSHELMEREDVGLDEEVVDPVPTGIPELDDPEVLEGGLGRKELGVIIAPPNVGKTMFLISLGQAALMRGEIVYHVSLEMSAKQIWKRYVSNTTDTNSKLISRDIHSTSKKVKEFYNMYGGRLIIDERPTKRFSPKQLEAEIDALQRAGQMPGLILIDYGEIMASDSRAQSDYQREADIYVDLRAICTKFNTRMWVPSQGNRTSVDKKVIDNEDIAGAFNKVATADFVCSINITKEEYQDGTARIFVSKNRRGKKNLTVEIDTKFETSRFVANIILQSHAVDNGLILDFDMTDDDILSKRITKKGAAIQKKYHSNRKGKNKPKRRRA